MCLNSGYFCRVKSPKNQMTTVHSFQDHTVSNEITVALSNYQTKSAVKSVRHGNTFYTDEKLTVDHTTCASGWWLSSSTTRSLCTCRRG
jgi:hypothetical protein